MDKALEILKKYYGYNSFRGKQGEIISEILNGNDVLTIMPTGGGKSICYQVPAVILNGITLVISPLISLMKDQVDSINNIGIESAYINSSLNNVEINEILRKIKNGDIKILYVAPERLESNEFLTMITQMEISQIAIDEAHCVSQWGHDFRVSYRRISKFISLLTKRPIVTAFTATATEEVRRDIVDRLELKNPKIFIAGFDRENLKIIVEKGVIRKNYLLDYIEKNKDESGIIYCATRKEVDNLHSFLLQKGIAVEKYHAGLSDEERKVAQEDFIYDKSKLIIATNAFGMGIDKPNIRYVIHYNMPKNIEGYYQEIGRAGRDGENSECIMLFSPSDVQTQRYIIDAGTNDPIRKENELSKLQTMINFVYNQECYRKFILKYFGEEVEENCNNCSNCELQGELVDKTEDAQKVISCAYRMGQKYGIGMIVDVLRGSTNKKVIEFGLDKLSTYNIMKNYTKDKLAEFINILISYGYLNYRGEYPVVTLNNKSMEIVKGQRQVFIKQVNVKQAVAKNNELFNVLRVIRMEIASEEKIPPYIIFGDNTLRELSTRMPINEEQFLDISGVGKAKLEKYGEVFMDAIKKYIDEKQIKVSFIFNTVTRESKEIKVKSDAKEKSYVTTVNMLRDSMSFEDVAKERGITIQTIFSHIEHYIADNNDLGFDIDFSEFFTEEEEKVVDKAISEVGANALKPIKEIVPESITYNVIKAVILKRFVINNSNI